MKPALEPRNWQCQHCGSEETVEIHGPHPGGHHARLNCAKCDGFIRWLPKPDADKVRRPAAHRNLARKFGKGFCEFCGRKETELQPGEVLEGNHIIEYADEGEPTAENTFVLCTACHKLCHWARHYMPKVQRQDDQMFVTRYP